MISRLLAAFVAWFYGTPRAFDAPIGPRFDSASVTLPEGGPYRSPGPDPAPGVVLFETIPHVPKFDAKAARALAERPPVCPPKVLEDVLKTIQETAVGGGRVLTQSCDPRYKVALIAELRTLGFKVDLDIIQRVEVRW